MSEYTHGVDYLTDYYALLGVPRDADQEVIKKGYRAKQKQYHPDRFEGLAPEFQNRAKEQSRFLAEAYAMLSNPEKKTDYDKQLASWVGPISKDGSAVIDLSKPRFSATALLTGRTVSEEVLAKQRSLAKDLSGYNPVTFRVIEQQYQATGTPDPELATAYREQLATRDFHDELLESLEFETVGLSNRQPGDARLEHVEHVTGELDDIREKVVADVDNTLFLIQSSERKLLGDFGQKVADEIAANPEKALALYRGMALERFEEAAQRIRDIATERQAFIEKRFQMIPREYRPPQKKIFRKLIVCIEIKEHRHWMAFEFFEGNRITSDDSIDQNELPKLIDPEIAQTWIDRGYNILFCALTSGLNTKDELQEITSWHFSKLEED